METDTVIAITAIIAAFISGVSLIFAVVFNTRQIRHNINSVRPISSINVSDYEDLIAVSIENVGTGPLLVKKAEFSYDNIASASTLLELMPQIDQYWTTYMEIIDGRTIPVGGKFVLIELHPESDRVRVAVRKALSMITVSLRYTDIYKTEFFDSRKLDFFGRLL